MIARKAQSSEKAFTFLKSWEPNGPWCLTGIVPDGPAETATFYDFQHATRWIDARNGAKNLYFSVNRPSHDLTKKARKADIGHALALHVDLDPEKDKPLEAERERIRALVEGMKPEPSIVIDSGGGFQAFWLFHDPLPLVNVAAERVEAFNRLLERAYGGDRCHNVDRIMRLPGTMNLPTKTKIAAGRAPALASVVRESDTRYKLDDLLPPRVARLPVEDRIKDLILGIGADQYSHDRSRIVFAVLAAMIRAGCTDEEMSALMNDRTLPIGDHFEGKSGDEVDRQIGRARDKVKVKLARNAVHTASSLLRAPWPAPIGEAAFRGLAGEIVRALEPHSEADLAALLVQLLVTFGSCKGRDPFFFVEATKHHTNLFVALVGETAKARKGTSWARICDLFLQVAVLWESLRRPGSLSSGEGLIYEVRDPVTKETVDSETGNSKEVIVDPGVEDKRLLVQEQEFAAALKVMRREGSTLSSMIRNAWDHGNLRTMTKHSPTSATNAHISIVGHCTMDELKKNLDVTEVLNGFVNRFLLVCVKRSKLLPFGGNRNALEAAIKPLLVRLKRALEFNPNSGSLSLDNSFECRFADEARNFWSELYSSLAEAKEGMLGAATARSEPMVRRLALIYALMDESNEIRRTHLESAMAVWRYAEASAAHIFGYGEKDSVMEKILKALLEAGPNGMNRREIRRDVFKANKSSDEITRGLKSLADRGLAREVTVEANKPGPKASKWIAVLPTHEEDEDDG
jgi:hypothetical protein